MNKCGDNNFIYAYARMKPDTVNGKTNATTMHYVDTLSRLVSNRIIFENVPDNIDKEILYSVFLNPPIAFIKTAQGDYALPAMPGADLDVYYRPKNYLISNHLLLKTEYQLGKDCEILHIGQYRQYFDSAYPLILKYAQALANCDASIDVSLINSRAALIFKSTNEAETKSAKAVYDSITRGEPAVFTTRSFDDNGDWVQFMNVKNTYIANDIALTKQTIFNEFLTLVGYNNANTDKRERLNQDEVNANNEVIRSTMNGWLENINECLKKINKMFEYNITCQLRNLGGDRDELGDDSRKLIEPMA